MVLATLREKTAPYHAQIEKNPLLSKLVGAFTQEDYISILKKFYGFYHTLELKNAPLFLKNHPHLQNFFFPKLPLLENDLKAFSIDPSQLSVASSFSPLKTDKEYLGFLYTLEGSCLGRAMLWPRIQKRLQLTEGGSFFSGAAGDLRERWGRFCQAMVQEVKDQKDQENLIEGAIHAFVSLDEWFMRDL